MTYDNNVDITSKLVADHGLKPDEYGKILQLIGRNPTLTELGKVTMRSHIDVIFK